MKRHTAETIAKAMDLRKSGSTYKEIQSQLKTKGTKVSIATLGKWVDEHKRSARVTAKAMKPTGITTTTTAEKPHVELNTAGQTMDALIAENSKLKIFIADLVIRNLKLS